MKKAFSLTGTHVLVASLLLNAGLLGFVAALLLVPGPRPSFVVSGQASGPMVARLPQFGLENRLLLGNIFERDAEGMVERGRRASEARAAFLDAIAAENLSTEEVVQRGEELKAAMDQVGGAFLDSIIAAVPHLTLEERRRVAAFLLHQPAPDFLFAGPPNSLERAKPDFSAPLRALPPQSGSSGAKGP